MHKIRIHINHPVVPVTSVACALLMSCRWGAASVACALLVIYRRGAASVACAVLMIYRRGAASVAALRVFLVHFLAFLVYFWAREGSPYLAK